MTQKKENPHIWDTKTAILFTFLFEKQLKQLIDY